MKQFFVIELALITHKPRAATVYAVGPVKVAGLSHLILAHFFFILNIIYIFIYFTL